MITKLRDYLQANKKLLAVPSAIACLMFALSSTQSPTNNTQTKSNKTLQQLHGQVLANLSSSQTTSHHSSLVQQKTIELYYWLNIGKRVGLYFSDRLLSERIKNDPYILERINKPSSAHNNHRDTLLYASSTLSKSILQEALLGTRLTQAQAEEQQTHKKHPKRPVMWAELKNDIQSAKDEPPTSQADIENYYHNNISPPPPTFQASGISISQDDIQKLSMSERPPAQPDLRKKTLDEIDEAILNEPENIKAIAERYGKKVKPVQSTHVLKTLQESHLSNELAVDQVTVVIDLENRIHICKLDAIQKHRKPSLKSLESSIIQSIKMRNHENRQKNELMLLEKKLNEEQTALDVTSTHLKLNVHRSMVNVGRTNTTLPLNFDANSLSARLHQSPGEKVAYTQKTKNGWLIVQLHEVDFPNKEESIHFSSQLDDPQEDKEIYFLTKGLLD